MIRPADIIALQTLLAELASLPRTARPATVHRKAAQDFVTDMDLALEVMLRDRLEALFPGIPVLGEESVTDGQPLLAGEVFLVDPLDGTGNWVAGLPFAAISVALLKNGKTVLAGVADIFGGAVYGAAVDLGAWRDETRLHPHPSPEPLVALSTGLMEELVQNPEAFATIISLGKLRNLGAQALQLCFVADGKLGLSASVEARLWDDAAGRLIVTEAGAGYQSGAEAGPTPPPTDKQFSIAAHAAYLVPALQALQGVKGFPAAPRGDHA